MNGTQAYALLKSQISPPGTSDYNDLQNKPTINGITLQANLSQTDLQLDTLPSGTSIPSGEFAGQLFVLTQDVTQASGIVPAGIYRYNGSSWDLTSTNNAIVIVAEESTTIDSYAVPVLSDSQITTAHDSYKAGRLVSIRDTNGYHDLAVIEVASLTAKSIKVLYRDVMIIEYFVGGTIDYISILNKQHEYEELLTSNKTIFGAINEIASIESFVFKGYVKSTAPTGNKPGELWYQGSTMPTVFPIAVKTWNGTSWSTDTTNYTPTSLDLWSNLENDHGYYWFGNAWNLIDVDVSYDDVSIGKNASGQLQVKSKVNNKALSGGDIVLDTNDIKANNTQTVQHNLERIDDELADRQIVHLISEFPEELEDYDLYRVEEEFTHESKTYSIGLYQVISGDLSKIEPVEGVAVDNTSIDFNTNGELEVKSKVNDKALSGGDITLDTNDIKADDDTTVQENIERIDDELDVRQKTHTITAYPTTLVANDLYRVTAEFTHESKTYTPGLYQVISNDLSKIEPAEGVAVDGETIEFNTDGELAVKDGAITNAKISDDLKATAISSSAVDTKLTTEKAVKDYAIPVTAPIIRQASGLITAGNTSTKVRLQQKENGTEQMVSYNAYYELGVYDDILLDFEYGMDSIGRYVEFSITTAAIRNIAIQVTIMTWEV